MIEELPNWLDEELWTDFQEHRKEIGKPLTQTAEKRLLMKLYRMKEAGEDIDTALERSIENGWKGVFPVPPELKRSSHQSHQEVKPPQHPESKLSDEEAAENVVRLKEMIEGKMKISGGRG